MNSQEEEEIKEIQGIRLRFHMHMQVLREKKRQLFSLFRSKLEEKKIEEIKSGMFK